MISPNVIRRKKPNIMTICPLVPMIIPPQVVIQTRYPKFDAHKSYHHCLSWLSQYIPRTWTYSDFPSGHAWPRLLLLAQLFQCHSLASGATGQRCAVVMAGRDLWKWVKKTFTQIREWGYMVWWCLMMVNNWLVVRMIMGFDGLWWSVEISGP